MSKTTTGIIRFHIIISSAKLFILYIKKSFHSHIGHTVYAPLVLKAPAAKASKTHVSAILAVTTRANASQPPTATSHASASSASLADNARPPSTSAHQAHASEASATQTRQASPNAAAQPATLVDSVKHPLKSAPLPIHARTEALATHPSFSKAVHQA